MSVGTPIPLQLASYTYLNLIVFFDSSSSSCLAMCLSIFLTSLVHKLNYKQCSVHDPQIQFYEGLLVPYWDSLETYNIALRLQDSHYAMNLYGKRWIRTRLSRWMRRMLGRMWLSLNSLIRSVKPLKLVNLGHYTYFGTL